MAKINKILFIDDDHICSFLNIALVEELDIANEVTSLFNAAEALKYLQENYAADSAQPQTAPDLIFLDIKMPGLDGFEFLEAMEKLTNIDRSRFLIIMLTASISLKDEERAAGFRNSIYAFLNKPLEEEALLKLLPLITKPHKQKASRNNYG